MSMDTSLPVNYVKPIGEPIMNLYKFQCTVWVKAESVEEALEGLHEDAEFIGELDDAHIVALESDKGEFDKNFD